MSVPSACWENGQNLLAVDLLAKNLSDPETVVIFCVFYLSEGSSCSSGPSEGGVLCGVMRIGLVAKGLLIKDDMDLELVLMCKEKPTKTLLCTVCDNLPLQIEVTTHTHTYHTC